MIENIYLQVQWQDFHNQSRCIQFQDYSDQEAVHPKIDQIFSGTAIEKVSN